MEPCISCFLLSPIVWNTCENLHYELVYFKDLQKDHEYYRPTTYGAEAAVVSTFTSGHFKAVAISTKNKTKRKTRAKTNEGITVLQMLFKS